MDDWLIDDAATTAFAVVSSDTPPVHVLASAALVMVAIDHTERDAGAAARIEHFLRERGIDARASDAQLVEGIVRDGEQVVVEGVIESTQRGEGYRGDSSEILIGRTDSPIVIRKLDAEPRK